MIQPTHIIFTVALADAVISLGDVNVNLVKANSRMAEYFYAYDFV